ncbi:FUSC family protein [Sinomonas sp. ASV486]|uniref:FUSC family protein n=1 Tax=Sinomonas sp. ASV486 TaxID=3051170 RepID=UPI0027DAE8B6|nr:FUSC family protein [Sinomonas sp. ASV486]MDQ4490818.1 FUSC family protein [Sinomonas sp. ASV486]
MGPLAAGSAVTVMGLGHPHWAAVAATVPLVGSTLAAQLARAAHRLAGTLVGCLLALSLLAAHPPAAVLVLAIGALQVATELLVTRHYGIAVICITPLALLLTELGSPAPVDALIGGRLDKSLLGVSAAVAILLATRIRGPRGPS